MSRPFRESWQSATWLASLLLASALTHGAPTPPGAADCPGPDQLSRDRPPFVDLGGALPAPDYLQVIASCEGTARFTPDSEWLQDEQRLYAGALAQQSVDVLLLPFQVQGYGLDRIERMLMGADLARAMASAGWNIADPFATARALGEGQRRFDDDAVEALASRVNSRYVVAPFVGHDRQHRFTVALRIVDRRGDSVGRSARRPQHDWRAVPFTNADTPALVWHRMLPEVVRRIGTSLPKSMHPVRTDDAAATPIEGPLAGIRHLPASGPTILGQLTLLAALAPPGAELPREHAFERVLLMALEKAESDDAARFLEAYALLQLDRRPVGLARLARVQAPAAAALRAVLDGDLPSAEASLARVPDSLERLLLQFEVHDLELRYDRKPSVIPTGTEGVFGADGADWQTLIALRTDYRDSWHRADPLVVKLLLDRTFPLASQSFEAVSRSSNLPRGATPGPIELDTASLRHVREIALRHSAAVSCCQYGAGQMLSSTMLDLLEGSALWRATGDVWHEFEKQGRPAEALDLARRYATVLDGHPDIEAPRARAALALARQTSDATRARHMAAAVRSAQIAARGSPGQNWTAYYGLATLGIPAKASQFMLDAYGNDYPQRPYWPIWYIGLESERKRAIEIAREALEFSSSDATPLDTLLAGPDALPIVELAQGLGSRLSGNPSRPFVATTANTPIGPANAPSVAVGMSVNPGGPPAVQASAPRIPVSDFASDLRRAIAADPNNWGGYLALGRYLIQQRGEFAAALEVFLSYPGFHDQRPEDRVRASNEAYDAGSLLYWIGQPKLAEPLYRISAGMETGSEGSMTSAIRLQIVAGDYEAAAVGSLDRSARYPSAYAFRDYISFAHAFGATNTAWDVFRQIDSAFDLPQVWASALVGHRRAGLDELRLRAWLRRPEVRAAHFRQTPLAPYYALWAFSTDRVPPADLGALVRDLEGPAPHRIDADGVSVLAPDPADPAALFRAPASAWRKGRRSRLPAGTRVDTDRVYFARGYAALRHGDYKAAATHFTAMADRYEINGAPLAYLAYALSRTSDPDQLEKFVVERLPMNGFDASLARAFFTGSRHELDAAHAALQLALRSRPHTDYRPVFTEYQYAEACEWLFRDTGDRRFRNALLDWARANQLIQPTQAWAYTMEYAYREPGPDRTRALAMSLYLDPASPRIKEASSAELADARAWLKVNQPFKPRRNRHVAAAERGTNSQGMSLRADATPHHR